MYLAALVTCRQFPRLTFDDRKLINPLQKLGIKAVPVIWDAKNTEWKNFDIVVLRSTWDYHERPAEFIDWINLLKKEKINLWNPAKAILWNINKKYLLELKNKGVPIIDTEILHSGSPDLIGIASHTEDEFIIKPIIGASAFKIQKLTRKEAEKFHFSANEEFLIQPFVKEIQTEGEISFVFIAGKFSHAISKKPKIGEFRAVPELGTVLKIIDPDKKNLEKATTIMQTIPYKTLYARIDCVNIKGQLHLMEAEIIEPELFLRFSTKGAQKLAQAIKDKINAKS